MSESAEVQNGQPMTETTYFILLSLAPGPSHGYAIMKDVQQLSQARVVLSTGTLYGALKRLLELGWIERVDDPAAGENGLPMPAIPEMSVVWSAWGDAIVLISQQREAPDVAFKNAAEQIRAAIAGSR